MTRSRRVPLAVLAMLSRRYWRGRLGRAAAGVIGVALGVALVVAVVAVNQAALRSYAGWVAALSGHGHVEVRAVETSGMPSGYLDLVGSAPGVAAAGGVVEQRSYLFTEERQAAVNVRGIDAAVEPSIRPVRLTAGRLLEVGDERATVLSAAAASGLGVGVGESVSLLSADGLLELRVVGVYGAIEVGSLARDRTALISLATAQGAFLQGREAVTQIDVLAADAGALETLHDTLAALVEPHALVQLPADELRELTNATRGLRSMLLLAGVMALVAAVFLIGNNLAAGVEERGRDLGVVRALGLSGRVCAGWLLAEAGVMGAVGSAAGAALGALGASVLMSRLPSELVVPAESLPVNVGVDLRVAALGAAVGLIVTLLAALPLAGRVARRPARLDAAPGGVDGPGAGRARPGGVTGGWMRRWLAPLLALPLALIAWRWLRLDPAGQGDGAIQASSLMLLVLLLGLALLRTLPALLGSLSAGVRSMAAPPLWLRLATDSLRRHARRTGATAVSLSIALASLVGVYGAADSYQHSLFTWLDAAVTWDLLVTGGPRAGAAAQPLPAVALGELAAVPGVIDVLPERAVTVAAGGRAVQLVAFDVDATRPSRRLRTVTTAASVTVPPADQPAAGSPPAARPLASALGDERSLALSVASAARLGVGAGGVLTLTTPSGETPFDVVALVEDPAAEAPGAYMDTSAYARAFGDPVIDEIGVLLAPGTDATSVIPRLARALQGELGERYPVQVVSAAAFRREVLDDVGATFAVVRALVLLAVVVALAGLLNAMLIGLWQLRQQLGLLRALGAPADMLVRTLAAEALLTALAGAATGVLLGTLLSAALLRGLAAATGPLLTWTPPLGAYLTVALLLVLAALPGGSLLGRARATPVAAVVRGE